MDKEELKENKDNSTTEGDDLNAQTSENNATDQNNNISSDNFQNEIPNVNVKDYYYSNVIARSSKTMIECNNSKLNLKSTGTEG